MTFIPNEDFTLQIAEGEVAGHTIQRKFGHSESLRTNDKLVSFSSPTGPPQLIAASLISVSSNSGNDTSAGSGARKIVISGLDASWAYQEETIVMNGTSTVTSVNTYIRLNRAYVSETGIYGGNNAGNITLLAGGTTMLVLESLIGQSETTFYSVPSGFTAYIFQVSITVETNKNVTVSLWQMPNANDVTTPFTGSKRIVQHYLGIKSNQTVSYNETPLAFPEFADIWMTGKTSSGSADCSIEYSFILIEN